LLSLIFAGLAFYMLYMRYNFIYKTWLTKRLEAKENEDWLNYELDYKIKKVETIVLIDTRNPSVKSGFFCNLLKESVILEHCKRFIYQEK